MVDVVALKNEFSRRSLLQSVPVVAATAFSLECITPGAASAQQTKLSQMLSKYQDTPKKRTKAVLYLLAFRCASLMFNRR